MLKIQKHKQNVLQQLWKTSLSDYVTAIAWTPNGAKLAASSGAGEVLLYAPETGASICLQAAQGESIDALAISADGRFLAAGGQAGTVWIWQIETEEPCLLNTLEHKRTWIDRLQWHPSAPELAFSFGRYVQVWDAVAQTVVTTLNFEDSSVLDLAWNPQGTRLSLGGNQSIKTWKSQDWDEDPMVREVGGASVAVAWSPEGHYLASGNNDRSVLVWAKDHPAPWRMQGFPGKVRQLAWSKPMVKNNAPLLASVSAAGIVVWTKEADESKGWKPKVLDVHEGIVRAIAFQPDQLLLASAAEDGCLYLWQKARRVAQTLKGASGFSCLAWSRQGSMLAAGGSGGQLFVWTKTTKGKGFK